MKKNESYRKFFEHGIIYLRKLKEAESDILYLLVGKECK